MEKETISWHGDTPEKSGFLFFSHDQVISFPDTCAQARPRTLCAVPAWSRATSSAGSLRNPPGASPSSRRKS